MPKIQSDKITKQKTKPELITIFSKHYAEKYPNPETTLSLQKQYERDQYFYFHGMVPDLTENAEFYVLNHSEIQTDTGTNAFLPPQEIEKVTKNLKTQDFSAYQYYQPTQALAQKIESVYKHLGYLPKSYKIDVELDKLSAPEGTTDSSYAMTYGHGTTEIFGTIMESIMKNKWDTIIVPTPTYGLFIPLMKNHCKIATLPSLNEKLGSIDPKQLRLLIKEITVKNIADFKELINIQLTQMKEAKVTKLSDNISLLSAIVKILDNKSLTEQQKLSQVDKNVTQYNNLLKQLKKDEKISKTVKSHWTLEPMPRVRALYVTNPAMPSGKVLTQPMVDGIADVIKDFSDITVIEDVVHRGVLLDSSKKIGTFTKSAVVNNTLILDGLSKIFSLPSARASFLIGSRENIAPIAKLLHMKNSTFNSASLAFLEETYGLGPAKFKAHTVDISQEYQKRLKLLNAVLLGIDTLSQTDAKNVKNTFYDLLKSKEIKQPSKELESFIFSGIPNVKLYVQPEAGYFTLLDVSAYIGKYLGTVKLETGMDVRNAFHFLADVDSIPDILCYDIPGKNKAYLRYSLSVDSAIDMVEGLLRIKKVLEQTKLTPTAKPMPEKEKKNNNQSNILKKVFSSPSKTFMPLKEKAKNTPVIQPRVSKRIENRKK